MSSLPVTAYLVNLKLYKLFKRLPVIRRFKGGLMLVKVSLVGFWLGLLRRPSFHALDQRFYTTKALYTSREHNRGGLWDWEASAIKEYFPENGRLLIAAVGAGREAIALNKLGYKTDAFEVNSDMVELANKLLTEAGYPANVRQAPRDQCPADLVGPYDGLIVGWGAYHHIPGREARVTFLREIGSYGRPHAPILLSFFVREPHERHFNQIAAVANIFRRLLGRTPRLTGDVLDPVYQHYFNQEEVTAELSAAGFGMVFFGKEGYGRAVGRLP